jgi:peptidyl-prolyl cis-trans isomerase SurA
MKKLGTWLAAGMIAVAAAPARAQEPTPQPPARPNTTGVILQKIIVKVNGEIFTQTDLEEQQILLLRERDPKIQQNDAALQAALAEITPTILVEAVDELLLIQRARELKRPFTDENFKNAIDQVKQQNKLDDAGLQKAMTEQGITMAQLRANFEKVYYVRLAQQEIMRNMTLTEQESRQYYAKHPEEFLKPATLTIREILIEVPTTAGADGKPAINAAQNEAAREKIAAARERLLKGEDFAAVAAEVSDSGTKANGGLIGSVQVSDLNPSLRAVFEKLEPGQVSEPVRTERGYQIFKLDARSAAEPLPYEQVKDQIAQRIYDQRLEGEMKTYLDKLREAALIEWRDASYKEMYEKKRAALAAASKSSATGKD